MKTPHRWTTAELESLVLLYALGGASATTLADACIQWAAARAVERVCGPYVLSRSRRRAKLEHDKDRAYVRSLDASM